MYFNYSTVKSKQKLCDFCHQQQSIDKILRVKELYIDKHQGGAVIFAEILYEVFAARNIVVRYLTPAWLGFFLIWFRSTF